MDFEQKKKIKENESSYHIENLRLVREFSKSIILEMKSLVKSIVLFGSNAKDTLKETSDIDIMIVLDNVSVYVTDELREAYRIIVSKLVKESGDKLHIMTINYSDFWDMMRKADPVMVNVLRYGVPIYDTGLIEPMQFLLETGRIKPSKETVLNYQGRAKTLLEETSKHLQDAILDLYYCVVDIVHSTLMIEKQMPPSPKEMPAIFKKTFAKKSLEKHSKIIDEFYKVSKDIEHKKLSKINGRYYDELFKKATFLVNDLEKYNNKELKKKDMFEL